MSSLKRLGNALSSLTRRHRPMSVDMEQCGTVGVKVILQVMGRAFGAMGEGPPAGHGQGVWCYG